MMTPPNRKKPIIPPSRNTRNLSEHTNDEEQSNRHPSGVESPFQVESLRQAATNVPSEPGSVSSVYVIRPTSLWNSMPRFKTFTVNGNQYAIHDDICTTRTRRIDGGLTERGVGSSFRIERQTWVARVLEIKARDESHVYLRVFWYYKPEHLPDGGEIYHGEQELIASNSMDVIDACTVIGRADLTHWNEGDEDFPSECSSFYWRQTYDVVTNKLSELENYCTCFEPQNPDEPLLQCIHEECFTRLHQCCIIESMLTRLNERAAVEAATTVHAAKKSHQRAPHPKPGESFEARIIGMDEVDETPKLEIRDYRSNPPLMWREAIVCLNCEKPIE